MSAYDDRHPELVSEYRIFILFLLKNTWSMFTYNDRHPELVSGSKIFILFLVSLIFYSCSVVRTLSGTEIDEERYVKAREARVLQVRAHAAEQLQKRLASSEPIDNADVVLFIHEQALNAVAHRFDSTNGWLDENTRMHIRSASLKLFNGVCILSLAIDAKSESYPVSVRLNMDCVLYLTVDEKNQLAGKMEAFNISPDIEAGGLLSGQEEMIKNIVKIRLAKIGEQLPPFVFPIDFTQQAAIEKFEVRTRGKIDLTTSGPRRLLNYTLQLKEILIFEGKVLIAMNVKNVEVK